jgi:hypothetical protein
MKTSFFCGNCDAPCELNRSGACAACGSEFIVSNPYRELSEVYELSRIYSLDSDGPRQPEISTVKRGFSLRELFITAAVVAFVVGFAVAEVVR